MKTFPIIELLSVLSTFTIANGSSIVDGLVASAADNVATIIQPYPLGHPSSPVGAAVTDGVDKLIKAKATNSYPYLMVPPIFKESSISAEAKSAAARSKEIGSGWIEANDAKWDKHGGEEGSLDHRSKKGEAAHQDTAHKQSKKYEAGDASQKWKQGSEDGNREEIKIVEEYNKNKGSMLEKKWSWEKERGSSHGWGDQKGNSQQDYKGNQVDQHNSYHAMNQDKESGKEIKEGDYKDQQLAGNKYYNQGTNLNDQQSHHQQGENLDNWDNYQSHHKKFGLN